MKETENPKEIKNMKIRMRYLSYSVLGALAGLASSLAVHAAPLKALDISLTPIGIHTNGPPYGLSDAEIVAHDPGTQRLPVTKDETNIQCMLEIKCGSDLIHTKFWSKNVG